MVGGRKGAVGRRREEEEERPASGEGRKRGARLAGRGREGEGRTASRQRSVAAV